MRIRFGSFSLFILFLALTVMSASAQPRSRTTSQRAATAGDLKVKYRTSVAGQTSESTSMIKGPRERAETSNAYTGNMATITQCDLKRTIQISDKVQKYVLTPMDSDAGSQANSSAAMSSSAGRSRRGGTITYTSTVTDTGERKELFGFTARHVKTSMNIESSPDACSPTKQRMDIDGWYIDLNVGLDCDLGRAQMMAYRRMQPDCQDQTRFQRTGTAKTGYALSETTTMYGSEGTASFTMTKEVLELSREPLDAALFDIPAGYTEAQSTQEFYGSPSMDGTGTTNMTTARQNEGSEPSSMSDSKPSGTLRIGVVPLNNKTDRSVSVDTLRERLIGEIQGAGVDAVPLNAESQAAVEAEARVKQCDFILYTDISALKGSKVGGMLGRMAGVSGAGKTESRIDFKLFAVGESSPRLQSSAMAKEDGDETSAGTALDSEARMVTAAVRRR